MEIMKRYANKTWQLLQLTAGIALGVSAGIAAGGLFPGERSGLPTSSAMGNIGYFVMFLQHVALLTLLDAVLLPAIFPSLCVRPVQALSAGLAIAAMLLLVLYFRLNLHMAGADYFAQVTLAKSAVASIVQVVVTYLVGIKDNGLLVRRAGRMSEEQDA